MKDWKKSMVLSHEQVKKLRNIIAEIKQEKEKDNLLENSDCLDQLVIEQLSDEILSKLKSGELLLDKDSLENYVKNKIETSEDIKNINSELVKEADKIIKNITEPSDEELINEYRKEQKQREQEYHQKSIEEIKEFKKCLKSTNLSNLAKDTARDHIVIGNEKNSFNALDASIDKIFNPKSEQEKIVGWNSNELKHLGIVRDVDLEKSEFKNVTDKASALVNNFINEVVEDMFINAMQRAKISDVDETKLFLAEVVKTIKDFDIDAFIRGIETKNRWEEMAFGDKEEVIDANVYKAKMEIINYLKQNLVLRTYTPDIHVLFSGFKRNDINSALSHLEIGKVIYQVDGYWKLSESEKENVG